MSNCVVEGGLHNALCCQPGALRVHEGPRQRKQRAVREVQLQLSEWERG